MDKPTSADQQIVIAHVRPGDLAALPTMFEDARAWMIDNGIDVRIVDTMRAGTRPASTHGMHR